MKDHSRSTPPHIFLSTVCLLVSGRRQKSDPDGSQRPVWSLRQAQAHPWPQEWDQEEDQNHPLQPQPQMERDFYFVSESPAFWRGPISQVSPHHLLPWTLNLMNCVSSWCSAASWRPQIRTAGWWWRCGTGTGPPGMTSWALFPLASRSWWSLQSVAGNTAAKPAPINLVSQHGDLVFPVGNKASVEFPRN